MNPMRLRPMTPADRSEVAELIYCSINVWYQTHGRPPIFTGGPAREIYLVEHGTIETGVEAELQLP